MWENIKPELLARLPHSSANGQANGSRPRPVPALPATDWKECFEKFELYRTYTDDWDGQGAAFGKPAAPITGEMVDSALALANTLRRLGVPAPHWTTPGVNGSINFDWQLGDGSSISLELIEPGAMDVFFTTLENKVEHLVVTESVTA